MPAALALALAPASVPAPAATDELDAFAGDRSFVMSFARGVSVIQAFAQLSRPLWIAEISHCSHIPRAAVRRLLHTLCELGYVKVMGLRYALTPKTLELGSASASSDDVVLGVLPIVNRLAERLHSFCALSVPEDDHSKARLCASASGLLFLSTFTDAQLDACFARVAMLPITFSTQTVPAQWRKSPQRVRAQGYAVCDRTVVSDLQSLAVPVHEERGTVVAAILAVSLTVEGSARAGGAELRNTLMPSLSAAA